MSDKAGWIATSEGGVVLHFSEHDGWKVERVMGDEPHDEIAARRCIAQKDEEIAALWRQIGECQKDAERYRWLRSKAKRSPSSKKHAGDIQVIQWEDGSAGNVLSLAALDAAIDAAKEPDRAD